MKSTEDSIARQLKAETEHLAEPFSPALHARIMKRVQNATPEQTNSMYWLRGAIAAVIAIGLMAVWIFMQPAPLSPIARNMPPDSAVQPDLSLVTDLIASTSTPLREDLRDSLPNSAMAGLDDDARNLSQFVVRQLDQLPLRVETTR